MFVIAREIFRLMYACIVIKLIRHFRLSFKICSAKMCQYFEQTGLPTKTKTILSLLLIELMNFQMSLNYYKYIVKINRWLLFTKALSTHMVLIENYLSISLFWSYKVFMINDASCFLNSHRPPPAGRQNCVSERLIT